ncbi:MAG: NAD(P)-dependent oxidoreductase [Candidatus Bathyarchaeota archaeon]|nr:NAD(P)-dependent oxidoreductase [Candidatus Bathyarchaeota archaeon]
MLFVKRIGFIGLGLMGSGMSMNLLKAGFPLTVWNRTKSKMKPLTDAGASGAGSPREVAEASDFVISIVTDSPDVEEVLLGPEGAIHGAKPGAIVIDMSTISPSVTRRVAEELGEKGVKMLDAPVSGGAIGARNGTLSIMVGGEEDVFEECLPVFEAMGRTVTHVGGNGMGQTVKLVNQILVGTTMLGVAEALMFAKKSGVDLEKCHQAVSGGAAGSWQLTNNGARLLRGDHEPGFKVKDYLKDLRLIMEAAAEMKMPLIETSVVHQMFRSLEAEGLTQKGTQAVIRAVERLAGQTLV